MVCFEAVALKHDDVSNKRLNFWDVSEIRLAFKVAVVRMDPYILVESSYNECLDFSQNEEM